MVTQEQQQSPVDVPKKEQSTKSRGLKRTASSRVFTTESYYHPGLYLLLAVPLLLIISQIAIILIREDGFQRKARSWTLVWTLFLIVGIYMMVLPKQIDVRSNGSIGVKTFLLTYQFNGICRAYMTGIERNDFLRPRLKFATAFAPPHRVVIRRKNRKWDLVVSPKDPEAFIQAVDQVVSTIEHQDDDAKAAARTMVEKQLKSEDLATMAEQA